MKARPSLDCPRLAILSPMRWSRERGEAWGEASGKVIVEAGARGCMRAKGRGQVRAKGALGAPGFLNTTPNPSAPGASMTH